MINELQKQYETILGEINDANKKLETFEKEISKNGYYIDGSRQVRNNEKICGFSYDCTYNSAYVGEHGQMYTNAYGKIEIENKEILSEMKSKLNMLKNLDVESFEYESVREEVLDMIERLFEDSLISVISKAGIYCNIDIDDFEPNDDFSRIKLSTKTKDDSYSLTKFEVYIEEFNESEIFDEVDSNEI